MALLKTKATRKALPFAVPLLLGLHLWSLDAKGRWADGKEISRGDEGKRHQEGFSVVLGSKICVLFIHLVFGGCVYKVVFVVVV